MRITQVSIPKEAAPYLGVEGIQMSRLDSVVILAGKNGSGKSRILQKISQVLEIKPGRNRVDECPRKILACSDRIIELENAIKVWGNKIEGTESQVRAIKSNLDGWRQEIETQRLSIAEIGAIRDWSQIVTSESRESYYTIPFVPKSLGLHDPRQLNKQALISRANETRSSQGIATMSQGALALIQAIQDRWWNATHGNSSMKDEDKRFAIEEYENLILIIDSMLGCRLNRDKNDDATLFGFPIGEARLSEGQCVLIQLCLAIHAQGQRMSESVLFLDEPENHLHPSAIIETMDRLRTLIPKGQIWVATHSIPVIAHFDPTCLWFVEDGLVSYAGRSPERVLKTLLGNDDEIGRLQDFLALPAQFATSRFAFESLLEPTVATTPHTDRQSRQIRADLLAKSRSGKLRVLDFGAGKGRTLSNIVDLDKESVDKLVEFLDYIAFDEFPHFRSECEAVIKQTYGSSENRYFSDRAKLLSEFDEGSFNVVLMCNVLHEVDPHEWLRLFGERGEITRLLSDDGLLLIVEDHQMPVGEKAHPGGFLVLDTPQLRQLFEVNEGDIGFKHYTDAENERIKAHQIPRSCLMRINERTRAEALISLAEEAKRQIRKIRASGRSTYKDGMAHGFWTQQLANAQLSLQN